MKTSLILGAAVGALALAVLFVHAPEAVASGKACFWSRNIQNTRSPNDTTVYVQVSGGDVYELKLFARCQDVSWSSHRLHLRTHGSSQICEGSGLNVEVVSARTPSSTFPRKCQVTGVRRLTQQEAAALPANARP